MVEHPPTMFSTRWADLLRSHVLKGVFLESEELRGFRSRKKFRSLLPGHTALRHLGHSCFVGRKGAYSERTLGDEPGWLSELSE